MTSLNRRQFGALALATTSGLLVACSGNSTSKITSPSASDSGSARATTVTVKDARGSVDVPQPAQRIAATDNRVFRTLEAWGIPLVLAPKPNLPKGMSYRDDDSVVDCGFHREPNLEAFVEARPDLIFNGQRFAAQYDKIKELVPDAALVDTDVDLENKPLDEELERQITLLGEALQRQDDAAQLIDTFTAARDRVKAAYDPSHKVMGLIATGGKLNYAAPVTGRAVGPLFPLFDLTPAIDTEGSSDHMGDDISVEAVASSNPDWIIVLDRDAAISASEKEGFQPAAELVEKSEALKNVPAMKNSHVIYLPDTFYLTEDIQAYTEVFTKFADALESARS